jgi:hypothetical protein
MKKKTNDTEGERIDVENEWEPARRDNGCGQNAAAAAHVYKVRAPRRPCLHRTEYSRTLLAVWGAAAILGGTANRDTLRNTPQRKADRDWRNG